VHQLEPTGFNGDEQHRDRRIKTLREWAQKILENTPLAHTKAPGGLRYELNRLTRYRHALLGNLDRMSHSPSLTPKHIRSVFVENKGR
jgi:hypothetical protein